LPVVDGYEVARRIRARDAKAILVAISAYGQADDRNARSRPASTPT